MLTGIMHDAFKDICVEEMIMLVGIMMLRIMMTGGIGREGLSRGNTGRNIDRDNA